jgi:hypothetical protein
MICGYCSREQNYRPDDCHFCRSSLVAKIGHGFWEGGKGKAISLLLFIVTSSIHTVHTSSLQTTNRRGGKTGGCLFCTGNDVLTNDHMGPATSISPRAGVKA